MPWLKIFANKKTVDFDNAEADVAILTFTCASDKGKMVIELDPIKFFKIETFTVFISTNYGDDVSEIKGLRLYGQVNSSGLVVKDFGKGC